MHKESTMPRSRTSTIDSFSNQPLSPSSVARRLVIRREDMERKSHDGGTAETDEEQELLDQSTDTIDHPILLDATVLVVDAPSTCSTLRTRSMDTIMTTGSDENNERSDRLYHQDSLNDNIMNDDDQQNKRMHQRQDGVISSQTSTSTPTITEMEEQRNKPPNYFDNNDPMYTDDDLILQQHVIMRQIQREASTNKQHFSGTNHFEINSSQSPLTYSTTTTEVPASRPSSTYPTLLSLLSSELDHSKVATIQEHSASAATVPTCTSTSEEESSSSISSTIFDITPETFLKLFDDPSAIEEQLRIMEQIEQQQLQQGDDNLDDDEQSSRIVEWNVEETSTEDQQTTDAHQYADPSTVEEQRRIMEQIESEQQRRNMIDEGDRIMVERIVREQQEEARQEMSSTSSSIGSTSDEQEVQQPSSAQHRKVDDDLPSARDDRRSPAMASLSVSPAPKCAAAAAASSGRRKQCKSTLQDDEDLSQKKKPPVGFRNSSASAFRRPPIARPGSLSTRTSPTARDGRRKKYMSTLHEDERLLKTQAGKHRSGLSKQDYSDDSVAELYGGRKLHVHGTKQTLDDIATGNAIFVKCPGCQTVLQVGSKAKILYCTICAAVSPIDLLHNADGNHDLQIAEAIQDEEVEIKVRRKMLEQNKSSGGARKSSR
jgi:hypothetical protein